MAKPQANIAVERVTCTLPRADTKALRELRAQGRILSISEGMRCALRDWLAKQQGKA